MQRIRIHGLCCGLLLAVALVGTAVRAADESGEGSPAETVRGLRLEKVGTEEAYFTHNGKPLLSFGGMSDYMFYMAEDAYDWKLWADWAAAHGMNHVRAYPPVSWRYVHYVTLQNGGSLDNALFPYDEVVPGSRQFDLTRFNEAYWDRFREKCQYLESKGIIIHLLMWNASEVRDHVYDSSERGWISWEGHWFNPAHNVNTFTDHLGGDRENRLRLYFSVANDKPELLRAQEAWFEKIVEETADLDNVYYDMVHEINEHHRDWEKVKPWIDHIAGVVRQKYAELQPDRPILLGMDAGGMPEEKRHWVYTRPYFDFLAYGKPHTIENAINWRKKYKKPYVPEEAWDSFDPDQLSVEWLYGTKWGYREPHLRVHTRKYMWKFMLAKVQQLDLYTKPRQSDQLPGYPLNYDPRGWNQFEEDALVLRAFWNELVDYPNLWLRGQVETGPGEQQYVLSSDREAIVYCSSATAMEDEEYAPSRLTVRELALGDGEYTADIVNPVAGTVSSRRIQISGGHLEVNLPAFTDDLAVHVYPPNE